MIHSYNCHSLPSEYDYIEAIKVELNLTAAEANHTEFHCIYPSNKDSLLPASPAVPSSSSKTTLGVLYCLLIMCLLVGVQTSHRRCKMNPLDCEELFSCFLCFNDAILIAEVVCWRM
jgi:hypothetical protein